MTLLVPRSLARDFRAICRRAFGATGCRDLWVRMQSTGRDVSLRAATFDAAIEYKTTANVDPAEVTVKLDLLDACQGSTDDLVGFSPQRDGSVRAVWEDRGVPWQRDGGKPARKLPEFPTAPTETATGEPGLLKALADACQCTDRENSRYALGCVQLRGESGQVVATDGRQVLLQSGFRFPWQGDVLIPGSKLFAARELPQDAPVSIGLVGKWICFQVGAWSIWLREQEGRFPQVEEVLRNPHEASSHLTVDPVDAAFVLDALPRLPAADAQNHPITLDLNGEALVRARPDDGGPVVELLLERSRLDGEQVKLSCNREYLSRALALGFSEFALSGDESIVQAHDRHRRYAWMPITAEAPPKPGQEVCRISSRTAPSVRTEKRGAVRVASPTEANVSPTTTPKPRETVMPKATEPTTTAPETPNPTTAARDSTIGQAVAVRDALRDTLAKANLLVGALKRQRRQSKLVESTLQSLKQLQAAG